VTEWLRALKYTYERLQSMTPAQQWRFWLLDLADAPYVWGAENPKGVDCSGTICWALWMMGYNLRVNAARLHEAIFVRHVTNFETLDDIMAVFYLKAGKVTHVTPVVGRYVVLDASGADGMVSLKTAKAVRVERELSGYVSEWRGLDANALEVISRAGNETWEVDPILKRIREGT
jgi:hypothetical protein